MKASEVIAKEATSILFILKDNILHHHFGFELENLPEFKDKHIALTKIKLLKSRAGLAVPTSFSLVYDRLGKTYLDDFQQIIEGDGGMKESDAISLVKKELQNNGLTFKKNE